MKGIETKILGFVYKWTNNVNGKWYIGSHQGNPLDGYTASGKIIREAFKKYGIDNFTREILYTGDNFRSEEEKFLNYHNAASCNLSYNLKNSASGGDVWCGRRDTEEYTKYLKKLSQPGELNGMFGKKHSEEAIDKMKIAAYGREPWNKGKTGVYTKEYLERRSQTRAGFKHKLSTVQKMSQDRKGSLNSNAKKVIIEGIEYETITDASKQTGLSEYTIRKYFLNKAFRD